MQKKRLCLTGAAGLVGSELAREFAEEYSLLLVDIDKVRLEQLALSLEKEKGADVTIWSGDLLCADKRNCFAANVNEKPIDILINNAATKPNGFFDSTLSYNADAWQNVLDVNLTLPFLLCQIIIDNMIKNGGGVILNVSSIYGVVLPRPEIYEGSFHKDFGQPINTPISYSVTKSALLMMSSFLAKEFGSSNVRVNSISFGGIEHNQNDVFVSKYADNTALGRMAQMDDILTVINFLISSESSYITGQNIIVDGGFSL